MTVKPPVNPKKLRPYDQPPKRRRSLVPSGPDSAAAGFFVAAALWLAVAGGLGVLAIGLRIYPIDLTMPLGFFGLGLEFNVHRVDVAFVNASVYGWLTNAGFAALAFMTPRLVGRRLVAEPLVWFSVLVWNMSLFGGLASLYVFELGPNAPLTAFPWLIDGGLATGAFIVTAAILATVAPALRTAYISLWFGGIALLGLLGLLSLDAGIGMFDFFFGLDDLPLALASAAIERAVLAIWLLGMAYATLHYVVPRAVGQPLASGGVAMLAWLTWLALAPLSALAVLADPSVPFIVTVAGSVATMLLLVPALLTIGNLGATMQGRWTLVLGTGAASLAAVALAFLLGSTLVDSVGSLLSVKALVGGTDWSTGAWIWAAFGAFTLAAFAMAEHAIPRIMRRAWGGGLLSAAQLWLAFAGTTISGLALMGSGIAAGSLRAEAAAPDEIDAALTSFYAGALAGFGLVALAGLALLVNLFMMYTSAEPAEYAIPGSTAAATGH